MLDREEQEELEASRNKKSDCGKEAEEEIKPRVSKTKKLLDGYKSPI